MSFGSGLASGLSVGMAIGKRIRESMERSELSDAMKAAATEEQQTVSEVNAPDAQNYTKDAETGNYAPSLAAVQSGVSDTLKPIVEPQYETKTSRVDKPFASAADKRTAMLQAGIDHLISKGKTDQAFEVASNLTKLNDLERRQTDEKELRNLFSDGRLSVQSALPTRNEAARSSIATGADITGANATLEHQSLPAEGARPAQPQAKAAEQQFTVDAYLKRIAPQAVQTLLKQGKLAEAKQFSEYVESEQGRAYAGQWLEGVRKHAIGDSAGALASFEKIYNAQLYNDGNSVRMTPLNDGQYRIDQIGADGQVLGSKVGRVADLANQAAHALSPMSAVKFHAEQQAQREKEGALLDRQVRIKELDIQAQEGREDRRDARLAERLDRQDASLDKRLAAQANKGLTPAQQRQNAEIDAARKAVAGMVPEEIRRLTAKATDSGRENPNYDPALAKAVALAGRRKIGDDPLFDEQTGGTKDAQPSQPRSRDEIAKEFRSDRKMDSYRLGRDTEKGTEVLDKQGRVIGHYN